MSFYPDDGAMELLRNVASVLTDHTVPSVPNEVSLGRETSLE
jgi:hypothetical protein